MKKNLAFVLGITPNISFAAGNVALGLNRHMKMTDYDIVIFYSGTLPKQDLTAFEKIPHVQLRPFSFPAGFVEHMQKHIPATSRFRSANALMTFSHFEIFSLLKEYRRTVWLDVDTSIQRDLSALADTGSFAITPDTPWTVGNQFAQDIAGYDMQRPGVCAAVMTATDALPFQQIQDYLWEKTYKYASVILNADQSVLNLMLQDFHITPHLLEVAHWQCAAWKEQSITARIVHFGTGKKVWNTPEVCNAFPEWYRTHLDWLDLGGSDFDRTPLHPKGILCELNPHKTVYKYYLGGLLPLWKIKKQKDKDTHYLFSCLPVLKVKKR